MPGRGRPKAELVLTEADREDLERLVRGPTTPQSRALRARVILESASGLSNQEVAARVGVNDTTVSKWRSRFIRYGTQGLVDAPRSGAPRTVTDEDVELVIRKTLDELPRGATHWSTRSMAAATGMSRPTIHRIWRAFGLRPHRTETFKLSTDPYFVDKVRDIVGLYLDPPERAVVLCVDEKSQVQALDRTKPLLPMRPGQAERRSHD
jgi:transposase